MSLAKLIVVQKKCKLVFYTYSSRYRRSRGGIFQ